MENIKIIEENNEKDDIIQLTSEMERLWYFENQKKENQINFYKEFFEKKGININEEIVKMYEESRKLAKDLGIWPYYMYRQKNMVGNMENLGYSKKGKECIYNIQMIEDKQTIIALGADAVTKAVFLKEDRIERFGNAKDLREYINRIDEMIEGKIKLLDSLYK